MCMLLGVYCDAMHGSTGFGLRRTLGIEGHSLRLDANSYLYVKISAWLRVRYFRKRRYKHAKTLFWDADIGQTVEKMEKRKNKVIHYTGPLLKVTAAETIFCIAVGGSFPRDAGFRSWCSAVVPISGCCF